MKLEADPKISNQVFIDYDEHSQEKMILLGGVPATDKPIDAQLAEKLLAKPEGKISLSVDELGRLALGIKAALRHAPTEHPLARDVLNQIEDYLDLGFGGYLVLRD